MPLALAAPFPRMIVPLVPRALLAPELPKALPPIQSVPRWIQVPPLKLLLALRPAVPVAPLAKLKASCPAPLIVPVRINGLLVAC